MDKRRYVQRRRAAAAHETRERILEAACASLAAGPLGAVRIDEVARAAGVARSTIYVAFGSRAGLFDAVAEYLLLRAGWDRIRVKFLLPDPGRALRESIEAGCDVYAAEPVLTRAILTLASIDPDAAAAVTRFERGRWPGMRALARRLERQGLLREGVTTREAAEVLYVLTSFATFDQLFADRAMPAATVARRLNAMAERTLLRRTSPAGSPDETTHGPAAGRPTGGS
jgi:AcrR family transcriptional regulator